MRNAPKTNKPRDALRQRRMNLQMTEDEGTLRVTASGTFSLQEAQGDFLAMVAEMVRHHDCNLLFDGRAITGEPKAIERFFYGEFAADTVVDFSARGLCRSARFAYV